MICALKEEIICGFQSGFCMSTKGVELDQATNQTTFLATALVFELLIYRKKRYRGKLIIPCSCMWASEDKVRKFRKPRSWNLVPHFPLLASRLGKVKTRTHTRDSSRGSNFTLFLNAKNNSWGVAKKNNRGEVLIIGGRIVYRVQDSIWKIPNRRRTFFYSARLSRYVETSTYREFWDAEFQLNVTIEQ